MSDTPEIRQIFGRSIYAIVPACRKALINRQGIVKRNPASSGTIFLTRSSSLRAVRAAHGLRAPRSKPLACPWKWI